jgi:DinB superfamily
MPDETLQLLAREVRGKTLRILDGVSDSDARFVPSGLNNSIIWHAGHSYWVVEALSVAAASGKPAQYPAGWLELFSSKSRPTVDTKFPSLAEVVAQLRSQLERLIAAIEPLSSQQLERIIDPTRNRTVRYNILHGLHDEASHQGEIWLLRKLQQTPAR